MITILEQLGLPITGETSAIRERLRLALGVDVQALFQD